MTQENQRKGFEERIINIDWPFNAPPPALRCLVTGEVISAGFEDLASVEQGEHIDEPDYESIPTVLFAFLGNISEFLYLRDDIKEMIAQSREASNAGDVQDIDDFEVLKREFYRLDDSVVVIELNTGGMACGPVWSTLWVGLDLLAPFREE